MKRMIVLAALALGVIAGCGGGTETVTVTTSSETAANRPASQPPTPEGTIGDPLILVDDYVSNGIDIDDELTFTLLEATADVTPVGNPYTIKEQVPTGYGVLRIQVEVRQAGTTESGGFGPDRFSAIDADGQQFAAASGDIVGTPLFPSSGAQLVLPPGESRLGYVGIPVPMDAKIEKISVTDAGFVPPSTAIWNID